MQLNKLLIVRPAFRVVLIMAILFSLAACQTTSSSPPGLPSPSSPTSSTPSASVPGVPSPPSMPSSKPGSSTGSEADSKPQGESGENGADGGGDAQNGDDVTFEESLDAGDGASGDVTFEEPSFEQADGLSDEQLDELEKQLNDSLGDFDEQMQREQTYAEERANENANEDTLGGVGVFENYQAEESDAQDQTNSRDGSSGAGAGGESGTAEANRNGTNPARGESAHDQDNNTPEDIPSGNDDDIVARQIREAAESESDPVLREKMWEEYRRYKNQ
jgi:hypothetical protein